MNAALARLGKSQDRTPNRIWLIVKAVLLENIRRREFYVVLLFTAMFLMAALIVRIVGIENAATATFLMNLGLTLTFTFAKIITLLTAARQFPDESEQRTLYPLLAKPLGRGEYLVGKWAASTLSGILTMFTLFAIAWLPIPHLQSFSFGTLVQMLILQMAGLSVLAALAIACSLLLPKYVNIVFLALVVLQGDTFAGFLRTRALGTVWNYPVRWVTGYLPDFSFLDLLMVYTNGAPPISVFDLLNRILYAIIFTAFSLVIGKQFLSRRPL